MRYLTFFLLLTLPVWSYPALPEPRHEEEALLIRRIIEFWRDKEYALVQAQIKEYLGQYPEGPFQDHFLAMLGDIALQNKHYLEALEFYEKVKNVELKQDVQLKTWHALYQLGEFCKLHQEIGTYPLEELDEQGRFFYAEAAFREALTLRNYPEATQEANFLLKKAQTLFDALQTSAPFGTHAKLGLAEIHRLLDQPEKAAELYLALIDKQENADILFHAATVLLQCNKQKAAQIFKKLAQERGPHAQDSAWQWLLLLAENEEWELIESERQTFTSLLAPTQLPVCYFYLGLINFEKKMYAQALVDLQMCLKQNLSPQHEKKALLALFESAIKLQKWELCESCFEDLVFKFPDLKPELTCMLALSYQKGENYERALKLYELVKQEFATSLFAEKACIEKARILGSQKKFKEAHEEVLVFLKNYPLSEKRQEMMRFAIHLSIHQLGSDESYEQLIADLENAFEQTIFEREEKREKELLLAKAYFKLGKIHTALQILDAMPESDALLMTQCYIKEGTFPEKVIAFGEIALEEHPEEKKLHLHLFNAYLDLSKEMHEKEYTRKAAEHLSAVIDTFAISLENRLWLAHYFAKDEPTKAIPLLETFIETEASLKRFDTEALLLGTLLLAQKQLPKAESLLEKIIALHQKTENEAKLYLAKIHTLKGDVDAAKTLYQELEDVDQLKVAYAARLEFARIDFFNAPEKNLKKLHELILHKTLAYEPIHLEAALEYAELKASSFPEEERPSQLLKLFGEMKDVFINQDNILSKDYHASREVLPDQDLIYQAYMRYLDARIYMLQAKLAQDPCDKKTKTNAARALFSTLRHGKYAVTHYIKEKSLEFVQSL